MTSNLDSEDINQETENKDCVLYFLKNISTEEGLKIIRQRKFKCGYSYVIEDGGKTIIRAIFYNHKFDLLSIRFSEDEFYLPSESSRLYINRQIEVEKGVFKAKHFPPINPFNEYSHTKSVIPVNVDPIDIYNIHNLIDYDLRLIPENYDIEIYRRKKTREIKDTINSYSERTKSLDALSHVVGLANLYKFDETYNQLDETLKLLYEPLLETHKSLFYNRVISLIECCECNNIIAELLELLGIHLDKDDLLNAMTQKSENNSNENKSIIERLKNLKELIKHISEREKTFTIIDKHAEWFEPKEKATMLGSPLRLSMHKSRI